MGWNTWVIPVGMVFPKTLTAGAPAPGRAERPVPAYGLLEGLELPIASDCGWLRKETTWMVSDTSHASTFLALVEVAPRRNPPDGCPCWPSVWQGIKRSSSASRRSCLCPTGCVIKC